MARIELFLVVFGAVAFVAESAKPLFDPTKCPNGCQMDDQCPENAACRLLDGNGNCGFCICSPGYKAKGNKCQIDKDFTTTTSTTPTTVTTTTVATTTRTEASTTTTTAAPETTTTTQSTTTGTTTQGPPPTTFDPVTCSDYDCTVSPQSPSTDDNPMQVQSILVNSSNSNPNCKRQLLVPPRPCNLVGGGACYGSYCLTVSPGNDYCICPYFRVDRQCAVDKPGKCSAATGQIPTGYTKLENRRLRNPSNKDNGSIYGRHFASNVNDCIKLCQWSQGACRSVNFGQIGGTNVCEQLSIAATERNLLAPWLEQAPGWTYVQVGQSN